MTKIYNVTKEQMQSVSFTRALVNSLGTDKTLLQGNTACDNLDKTIKEIETCVNAK